MPLQRKNNELIDLLLTYAVGRDEPQVAWFHAIAAMQMLPGLRGLWPMSAVNGSGNILDVSGNGRTLTNNNLCLVKNIDLAPCVDFVSGSSQYLSRVDEAGLDITGGETYIQNSIRGLTMGGWFQWDALGTEEAAMSKWTSGANQRAYRLYKNSTNVVSFQVSSNGTATTNVSSTSSVTAGPWFFVVGRFDPSTELKIWLNNETDTNVASIPATIFNSSRSLEIGRHVESSTYLFSGEASLCFLCAAYLEDYIVNQIYEQTRALFNV